MLREKREERIIKEVIKIRKAISIKRIRSILFERDGLPKRNVLISSFDVIADVITDAKLKFIKSMDDIDALRLQVLFDKFNTCIGFLRRKCLKSGVDFISFYPDVNNKKIILHGFNDDMDAINISYERIKKQYKSIADIRQNKEISVKKHKRNIKILKLSEDVKKEDRKEEKQDTNDDKKEPNIVNEKEKDLKHFTGFFTDET